MFGFILRIGFRTSRAWGNNRLIAAVFHKKLADIVRRREPLDDAVAGDSDSFAFRHGEAQQSGSGPSGSHRRVRP
mgnify:CR=1 FL=1